MQIGLLKHTIEIQQKNVATDEYGAETVSYQTMTMVMADVRYKSGSKAVEDMGVFNNQFLEINIRYLIGIDESMRVLFDGRVYKINFINEPAFRSVLQLNVERINENM